MAESYFGTHLCKLTFCLCCPLFQERAVVNLNRFHCTKKISAVIRQKGKTHEDKEVTNENSKGARYLFRMAETHNTQINLFSMTLGLKRIPES